MNAGASPEYSRAMLFVANARFAPTTQLLKQNAIQQIAEQILVANPNGLAITEIQRNIANVSAGFTIGRIDLEKALESVAIKEKVSIGDVAAQTIYKLDARKIREVTLALEEADRKIDKVLTALFSSCSLQAHEYKQAFMEALAKIFFQFGTKNAEIVLVKPRQWNILSCLRLSKRYRKTIRSSRKTSLNVA